MKDHPSLASMGLPGMLDPVEMMRKAWSAFSLPTALAPTIDLDELDKRIADLKAVEQWLNMNLGMLRGTIQGLEVQRGTLAAVKTFSDAVTAGGHPGEAASQAMAAVAAMQRAFGSAVESATAAQSAAAAPPGAAGTAAGHGAAAAPGETEAPPASVRPAPRAPGRRPTRGGERAQRVPPPEAGAESMLAEGLSRAAAAVNPAAWWDLLQSQFSQVAEAALAGSGLGAALAGSGAARSSASERAVAGVSAKAGEPSKAAPAAKPRRAAAKARAKARRRVARPARKLATPD